jgi:hypothetical protein
MSATPAAGRSRGIDRPPSSETDTDTLPMQREAVERSGATDQASAMRASGLALARRPTEGSIAGLLQRCVLRS